MANWWEGTSTVMTPSGDDSVQSMVPTQQSFNMLEGLSPERMAAYQNLGRISGLTDFGYAGANTAKYNGQGGFYGVLGTGQGEYSPYDDLTGGGAATFASRSGVDTNYLQGGQIADDRFIFSPTGPQHFAPQHDDYGLGSSFLDYGKFLAQAYGAYGLTSGLGSYFGAPVDMSPEALGELDKFDYPEAYGGAPQVYTPPAGDLSDLDKFDYPESYGPPRVYEGGPGLPVPGGSGAGVQIPGGSELLPPVVERGRTFGGFPAGNGAGSDAMSILRSVLGGGAANSSPWTGVSALATIGSALYGMDQSRRLRKSTAQIGAEAQRLADPFGSQRPQYQQQLSELMANPSARLENLPGYKAGLDAVTRKMASQGYLGSGNMMAALHKYGGDVYNSEATRLAGLAGANISPSPGAGASIAATGETNAASILAQALNRLGYGAQRSF